MLKEGYTKHRGQGVGKKKKQNNNPDPSATCKARQTFRKWEYFALSPFWGGAGEQRAFLSLVPREGAGKDGGGRPLLSRWLLTKQFCQLAVGAAWGFAIELLEGGGGCAGGREGRAGPAAAAAAPSPSWHRGLGPLGTAAGSFGSDARVERMCLHPCLSGPWCGATTEQQPQPQLEACPVQEPVPVPLQSPLQHVLLPKLPEPAAGA